MISRVERFWLKTITAANGCILWRGARDSGGYGRFWLGHRLGEAHRFAYELANGAIPKGLDVDHLCRNRLCVNPLHLEAVTRRENLLRGNGSIALFARQTQCANGHAYTTENTYFRPDGRGRQCKECRKIIESRRQRVR